jgi:seryl-tRNA synthetase
LETDPPAAPKRLRKSSDAVEASTSTTSSDRTQLTALLQQSNAREQRQAKQIKKLTEQHTADAKQIAALNARIKQLTKNVTDQKAHDKAQIDSLRKHHASEIDELKQQLTEMEARYDSHGHPRPAQLPHSMTDSPILPNSHNASNESLTELYDLELRHDRLKTIISRLTQHS